MCVCSARLGGRRNMPQHLSRSDPLLETMTRTWWLGSLFLSPPSLSLVSAHEPGYVCQALVCSLCNSGGPIWVFEGQILRAGYYVFNKISQNVKGDEDKIIYMHTYCGITNLTICLRPTDPMFWHSIKSLTVMHCSLYIFRGTWVSTLNK